MSSVTASKKVLKDRSLSMGGLQLLLLRKGVYCSVTLGLSILSLSKKYLVSRMHLAKSEMSAVTYSQLICRGVGQNVSPCERKDNLWVDRGELERLMTEELSG